MKKTQNKRHRKGKRPTQTDEGTREMDTTERGFRFTIDFGSVRGLDQNVSSGTWYLQFYVHVTLTTLARYRVVRVQLCQD